MHRLLPRWFSGNMAALAVVFLTTASGVTMAQQQGQQGGPARVELKQVDGQWQLLRGAEPFFIKGAGGDASRQLLADLGGNSFRTWGADNLDKQLDEAQRLGLAVTVGIWLGHERHGFNYNNADQVAEQYERARQAIVRYKDHPAVLMWGIGNEMEGFAKGDNAAIWSAINNIASLAKRLDPNHPTMTVLTEVGGERVKNVHRLCPDIDIVGINSYAGLASLAERYKKAGGTKPFVVTEFGPPGTWELGKNGFGAVAEPTSTEKADWYRRGYAQSIAGAKGLCLGSYCFAWGSKQEGTSTWLGMFLPDGTQLEPVHTMAELWSGKAPANHCPQVKPVKVDGRDEVDPGQVVHATLDITDPDSDPLTVKWILQREGRRYNVGGDQEQAPPSYPDAIQNPSTQAVDVKMPAEPGIYRLYALASDGHNNGATSTVLLLVKGEVPAADPAAAAAAAPVAAAPQAAPAPSPTASAPRLVVFGDGANSPYIPSGWMGNAAAIRMDEKCAIQPHTGNTCMRLEYQAPDGFGGIIWQDPPNDWGDQPGGRDLTGAAKLTFWARGHNGGEKVKFVFGVIKNDKPHFDTAGAEVEVALTKDWKQHSIDLDKKDLSRIKTGFGWVVGGQGAPVTFYLDDIRYE